MKKVLSFVLVLALVLSSFSMAFAATTTNKITDVKGEACEMPVQVLTSLGVVAGFPDGTYKPEQVVTRAEMAKLVIVALGLEEFASKSTTYFSDMAGSEWAAGYVGYAASLGIIKGYPDGKFGPINPVSYDEAITMIVRAIGYTENCKEMNGAWPAVFAQKARTLGVLDDVTAAGANGANRGDVAIMLYNAIDAAMVYADGDGATVKKYEKDGLTPTTMLSVLNKNGKAVKDTIITASETDNAVVNIADFLGASAGLVYYNSDNEVIAVSDLNSEFISGEFNLTDKEFDVAGKTYDVSRVMDTDAAVFENGIKGTAAKLNSFLDETILTLAVKTSGKYVTDIYSILEWDTAKASADQADTDLKDEIKDDQKMFGKEFILDDNDGIDYRTFSLVGVDTLDAIKANDVVYVYADANKKIRKIEVSNKTVEGKITKVSADGNEFTIGGTVYKSSLNDDFETGLKAGSEVKAYLDAQGRIFCHDFISGTADKYAVVVETGDGTVGLAGKDAKIKLALADGTVTTFVVDEDASADLLQQNAATPAELVWTGLAEGNIIKYNINKSGVLDEIVKPTQVPAGTAYAITAKGTYNGKSIQKDAVILTYGREIISKAHDADEYGATTLDKVLDSDAVKAAYVLDGTQIAAMFVYDISSTNDVYGVVTGTFSADGDYDYGVEMILNTKGEKQDYFAKKDLAAKSTTELFKVSFDATGAVKDLSPVINAAGKVKIETVTATTAPAIKTVTGGYNISVPAAGGNKDYVIDKKAVVYVLDGTKLKVGTYRDLAKTGAEFKLYDVFDDVDGIYDIVVLSN